MAHRRDVWLDCDPGHDDAMALLLAAHSARITLVGVSTVAGNQSVDKTTANAARFLDAIGADRQILVTRGQSRPLLRVARHDPGIHGESGLDGSVGLDGVPVREARMAPAGDKGVVAMAKAILQRNVETGQKVTLVATGALTNVALMLSLYPEVMDVLDEIVIMGGAMGIGNRHPVAEFNILCDPESAKVVFDAEVKVVLVPLEVTHTALAGPGIMARISAFGTPHSEMIVAVSCRDAPVDRVGCRSLVI